MLWLRNSGEKLPRGRFVFNLSLVPYIVTAKNLLSMIELYQITEPALAAQVIRKGRSRDTH